MRTFKYLLSGLILIASVSANASLISVESRFFQDGFDGSGSISGFFRGTDLNGDGQLLSVSPALSFFSGVGPGNELDYAEITFSGLGTTLGSQTLVYDKSVADVTAPQNLFFGFAYNIGSGLIGDEANEGFSFSPFAPSTNYLLGEAFLDLFIGSVSIPPSDFGSCDGIKFCSVVLELVPDPTSPSGIRTFSQNLSSAFVQVSEPSTLAILGLAIFGLFKRQRLGA